MIDCRVETVRPVTVAKFSILFDIFNFTPPKIYVGTVAQPMRNCKFSPSRRHLDLEDSAPSLIAVSRDKNTRSTPGCNAPLPLIMSKARWHCLGTFKLKQAYVPRVPVAGFKNNIC